MTARRERLAGSSTLVAGAVLAGVESDFAQGGGVGGNIGTFIQNIINILNA